MYMYKYKRKIRGSGWARPGIVQDQLSTYWACKKKIQSMDLKFFKKNKSPHFTELLRAGPSQNTFIGGPVDGPKSKHSNKVMQLLFQKKIKLCN